MKKKELKLALKNESTSSIRHDLAMCLARPSADDTVLVATMIEVLNDRKEPLPINCRNEKLPTGLEVLKFELQS